MACLSIKRVGNCPATRILLRPQFVGYVDYNDVDNDNVSTYDCFTSRIPVAALLVICCLSGAVVGCQSGIERALEDARSRAAMEAVTLAETAAEWADLAQRAARSAREGIVWAELAEQSALKQERAALREEQVSRAELAGMSRSSYWSGLRAREAARIEEWVEVQEAWKSWATGLSEAQESWTEWAAGVAWQAEQITMMAEHTAQAAVRGGWAAEATLWRQRCGHRGHNSGSPKRNRQHSGHSWLWIGQQAGHCGLSSQQVWSRWQGR